jgi:hypothetical protein
MIKIFFSICVVALLALMAVVAGADQPTNIASEKLIGNSSNGLIPGSIVFSPDGDHLAYMVKVGDKMAVNLDGVLGPAYNRIGLFTFSSNGNHFAYGAMVKNETFIIVRDGKEGPEYDNIIMPQFNSNGSSLAYIAKSDNRKFMVVDGKEESKYDNITAIKFSPNGDHYFYVAALNESQFVVVDGQKGQDYDKVSFAEFNPDGSHLAHIVQDEFFNNQFVVLDSKQGKRYDRIIVLNGSLFDQDGNLIYIGTRGSEAYLVKEISK